MGAPVGRDLNVPGLISSKTHPLVEDLLSATPLLTGHLRTHLTTSRSTMFLPTPFTLRDTHLLEMLRTPSQFLRTDQPALLTSSSRVIRPRGLTTLLSVRDVLLVLPTRTDLPRLNAVSTLLVPRRPLTATFGRRDPLRTSPALMLLLRLRTLESLPLSPFMLLGANFAREWRRNMPSSLTKLALTFTSSGEMRSGILSKRSSTLRVSQQSMLSKLTALL
mmetsp:Transcript_14817/g.21772  ORF Transcript_14817/g.21772 Transcript_14817/m.21772 type:complete len:220 (+) Transcript_14817:641-1300(+)